MALSLLSAELYLPKMSEVPAGFPYLKVCAIDKYKLALTTVRASYTLEFSRRRCG